MEKKIPQRRCMGCMTSYDKNLLIRVVKTKENTYFFDEKGSCDGRGAYICKNAECINKVLKGRKLNRAFKAEVPAEIYDALERQAAENNE